MKEPNGNLGHNDTCTLDHSTRDTPCLTVADDVAATLRLDPRPSKRDDLVYRRPLHLDIWP